MRQRIHDWWEDKAGYQKVLGTIFLLIIAAIIGFIIYFFACINPTASGTDVMDLTHPVNLTLC